MTSTSDSAHPLKKALSTPPAAPASSCFRCYRDGTMAEDQRTTSGKRLTSYRFECHHCGHMWTTSREEADAHGRFLRRIDTNTRGDS